MSFLNCQVSQIFDVKYHFNNMETMIEPISSTYSFSANQEPVFLTQETQMSMWKEEISFYRRLLRLSLLSCKEEYRTEIESLIAQLEAVSCVDLPNLKEKWDMIHKQLNPACNKTAGFQDHFLLFNQNLNSLKSKIFYGFSHFGRVQIW